MTRLRCALLLAMLTTVGCSPSPVAPDSAQPSPIDDGAMLAKRATRAVLNKSGKVVGISSLVVGTSSFNVAFASGGLSYNEATTSVRSVGTVTQTTPYATTPTLLR